MSPCYLIKEPPVPYGRQEDGSEIDLRTEKEQKGRQGHCMACIKTKNKTIGHIDRLRPTVCATVLNKN